jgi:hypothetical protein
LVFDKAKRLFQKTIGFLRRSASLFELLKKNVVFFERTSQKTYGYQKAKRLFKNLWFLTKRSASSSKKLRFFERTSSKKRSFFERLERDLTFFYFVKKCICFLFKEP